MSLLPIYRHRHILYINICTHTLKSINTKPPVCNSVLLSILKSLFISFSSQLPSKNDVHIVLIPQKGQRSPGAVNTAAVMKKEMALLIRITNSLPIANHFSKFRLTLLTHSYSRGIICTLSLLLLFKSYQPFIGYWSPFKH